MIIQVDRTGTVAGFKDMLRKVLESKPVKGLLILACDANNFRPIALNGILKTVPVPLFGGIFPEILHAREKLARGTIIAGLSVEPNVQIIPKLSHTTVEYDDIIDKKIPEIGQAKTMFVLVDGLSQRISALIDSLFNIFGLEINYIGGGAGSLSFKQKPCLFTNQGLIQDSALLALANIESGIGVSHGWNTISGPFKVTEVDRNIIKTLDWEPAFKVYREAVEKASGKIFTNDNFYEIAKGHPFGINKLNVEKVVRGPIKVAENGALICVGEVPEESYIDILSGSAPSLINAAANALALGREAFKGPTANQITFFIDCISRVLFLEDDFDQELNVVFDGSTPLIGALTLGEIANNGQDYLEFYNKTAVIGILEA